MDAGSAPIGIAWDTWRAERGRPEGIARRQHAGLAELVEFARSASPYHRRLYRDVPDDSTDPGQLRRVGGGPRPWSREAATSRAWS